jgi:K+-transporting ATPase KdpF subunit
LALSPLTRGCSPGCKEGSMLEIFIGLAVALALGAYLIVTLILPERF